LPRTRTGAWCGPPPLAWAAYPLGPPTQLRLLLRAAGTGTTRRRPRAAGVRRRLLDLLSRASPAGDASHFAAPCTALPRVPPRPPLLHPKIAAQGQKQEGES